MKLTIKGQLWTVPSFSTIKIMPFLSAMGLTYDDLNGEGAIASDPNALGRQVLTALAEPTNHYKLAFSLAQLIPDIDPKIASFQVVEEGGQKVHKFCLELEPVDLIQVLDQINQHFLRLAAEAEGEQQQSLTVDLDPSSGTPLPVAEDDSQFRAPLPHTLVQRRDKTAKPKGFAQSAQAKAQAEAQTPTSASSPIIDGSQARIVPAVEPQDPKALDTLLSSLPPDVAVNLLTNAIARREAAGQPEP